MSMLINPYVFGAGGGGGIDPTTITGCTEWVSADQPSLSGLVNNDPVSTWLDRVTGTRAWTAAGTVRPTFKTGGPNGKPYLSWDATDNMDWSNTIGTLIDAAAYTMFIVIRPQRDGANADPQFCPIVCGTTNQYFGISLRNTGGGNKFVLWQFNSGYGFVESTTTFSQNVWYIVECWYDGTSISIKVNNDTTASAAKTNVGQVGHTPSIGNDGLTSDITKRFTHNVSLDSTDRTTLRQGLATEFNITLAP